MESVAPVMQSRRLILGYVVLALLGPTLVVPIPKWHHHADCADCPDTPTCCALDEHHADAPDDLVGTFAPVADEDCRLCHLASIHNVCDVADAVPAGWSAPDYAPVASTELTQTHTQLPIQPRGPPLNTA